MRTLRHFLRTVLLLALPAHQLAAQQIGGTVVDIVTGDPVPAVTVELLDPGSTVVATVTTDNAGEFLIAIPAPGTYRIGTRHTGYQDARSASLELEAQDTLTVQYRLAPEVVVLNPLTVVASSRRQPGSSNAVLLRGCEPAVFIDGVRIHGGAAAIDELVSPIEIAAVEVYRGPSEVPVEFSGPETGCGAIVIWTN